MESAVVRRDFYDFMGLRSAGDGEPEMLANERRTVGASQQHRPEHPMVHHLEVQSHLRLLLAGGGGRSLSTWSNQQGSNPKSGSIVSAAATSELHLTGGEPSLYKKLPELIALLDPEIELVMNSNLGKALVIERFLEHVSPDRFRKLIFSLHPTQVPMDTFFAKLAQLKRAGYRNLVAEMVLYPLNLPLAGEVVDRCRDLGVSLSFDPYVPAAADAMPRDEAMLAQMQPLDRRCGRSHGKPARSFALFVRSTAILRDPAR